MKCYCCLFTCLTIRAVHIDVTRNLQKSSCIMAFQRFFNRRGLPERFHSDNALYFTSTAKTSEESSFTTAELKKYAESKKIAWKFIPPGAPHFGGTCERLTEMSKRLFFKIAGSKKLQEESFPTLIRQVGALLNSRPLTSVSSDIRGVESLTPGHFLQERQQDCHQILQLAVMTEEQENYGAMATASWTNFGHAF